MSSRIFTALLGCWFLACMQSPAKQVGEAITDMGDVQTSDPNGYTLMIISICILFFIACTLIGVTVYMMRGKKKSR